MTSIKLGFHETDITPDAPMQLIGFASSSTSQGVERPLRAQVSIWQSDTTRCTLVTIDHIGFAVEHAARLRSALGILTGTDSEHVMLCFSHTHAAPNDSLEPAYARLVDARILAAARVALASMRPVRVAWGCADTNIGVNRRGGGALDRRAGLLKVADAETDAPVLALLRLTAHGNSLKSDNARISSDWLGAARDLLSRSWGCPVMLTQGASGNVAPRFFCSRINPPDADDTSGRFVRTDDALNEMARTILRDTRALFDSLRPHDTGALRMFTVRDTLYAGVPTIARARSIAEEAAREAGIDGKDWLSEVSRLNEAGVTRQSEPVELQFFQLDEGALIGVPNEIMCELALDVRAQCGDLVFLGGYTNGCTGYLPTAEEYDRGGYEVFWSMLDYYMYFGRVMPLERDSAARLVQMAVNGLRG